MGAPSVSATEGVQDSRHSNPVRGGWRVAAVYAMWQIGCANSSGLHAMQCCFEPCSSTKCAAGPIACVCADFCGLSACTFVCTLVKIQMCI
jgi:hypothetical protein